VSRPRTFPCPVAVVFALLGSVAVVSAQPSPRESTAASQRLDRALAARDWPSALAAAVAVNESIEVQHVETLYTIARCHALLGHADRAMAFLERVLQAGLFDVSRVRDDEAFAGLRADERFTAITQAIWLKGYLWLLERPERDAYQQPDRVMQTLAIGSGERVADIGAGSGYFTRRIARAVGPTATVLALDIRPQILEYLADRVASEGITNVRTARVDADDPHLPAGSLDTVLMVDTLHYVKDRAAYAKKLRAGLAPGGRVVVIDFIPRAPGERPWGPPPEQNMSRDEVDAAMAAAGLTPVRVHDFLAEQFFVEYGVKAPAP
jgi:arsenite methyltransferase